METLLVGRSGGVVTVTMNRPERKNAATPTMWAELRDVFTEVGHAADDRVLVVTGAGGDFCSGADLSGLTGTQDAPLVAMRLVGSAALALHRCAKPTIAKVRGVAVGAGCNLALGCDLTVASEDARFSEIFSRRGLSVDFGGSWVLPRLVGLHKAKELALLGDIISAKEAADYGLLNRVVADGDLDAVVEDWARRLAAGPPLALSMTKTLLNNGLATSLDQAVEDEARCQAVNIASADTAEAMMAFLEKREPRFQGR
ncbi:MAG TPA: enoyl-CoA hydratase [Acidimicrobiales bacterium]|nr:enoyl-CoA hydratase [Acidimicrobiales bacterium]